MKGLQFAAHYTLSFNKSDDDGERIVNSTYHQNPFDFSRDYNWSALDARHQISGYAIYQAPWGIELSTLFRYRSGLPIDASTGEDTSELQVGNLTNRPLQQPGVFFLRNAFRNRDYKTVDFRLLKDFRLRDSVRLQFSGEMFNLFNTETWPSSHQRCTPAIPRSSMASESCPMASGLLWIHVSCAYGSQVDHMIL